jgi:hypothetical protein
MYHNYLNKKQRGAMMMMILTFLMEKWINMNTVCLIRVISQNVKDKSKGRNVSCNLQTRHYVHQYLEWPVYYIEIRPHCLRNKTFFVWS